MKIPDVLDAIAARLATIDGLTVTTDPGAPVVVPMALVVDGQMEYHATFGRGFDTLNVDITVFVSRSESSEGAFEAREYKSGHGARSIRAALETSTGVGDVFPNQSIRAGLANDTVAARGDASFIAIEVTATAQIPGKE